MLTVQPLKLSAKPEGRLKSGVVLGTSCCCLFAVTLLAGSTSTLCLLRFKTLEVHSSN